MVLKANDRRTSCPCHDEFRGPRSDYVRQVALENNNNKCVSFLAIESNILNVNIRERNSKGLTLRSRFRGGVSKGALNRECLVAWHILENALVTTLLFKHGMRVMVSFEYVITAIYP
ncbi:hypothetical protein TNCV_742961 [Trichonephila clavipes]|nr:hypothetical protein TNCV_742961 [Trichonephila clavipes]